MSGRAIMELTDAAAERVRKLVENADGKAVGLRIGVKNGGCAGMSYTVEMAEDVRPGETLVEDKGAKVLIDPKALLFLIGARMDFAVTKLSATFTFDNPNETASCGCGESVSLTPVDESVLKAFAN
ncbi:iron-sulfur cluster assembly accessory protein [Rhodoblastus acidophilus]|uniref:Iron-sulfur cluster assembly accessory protein n=1 Tax=Candidatus Rhodoblastus alkanivorans TaxID=2954117 RepID=A0ABS9Z6K7_9HYPH|nr:iron-sulfur cluster assembly accessory protein [Candidatus Rhodoblastus alkanivorans]MCI4679553.1 iron-sulfur cluster assembly accessory protein [Candidatus Rhodoblastus alkanivorans]MCI4683304.1 iron-sulfur cluster assembly accessory protein [Candidatus Rhodoblastus alkanivorans]MDI4640617.1 iron-sulfur cluster assembly accessory protein [Rhodoblastus acidophilus]